MLSDFVVGEVRYSELRKYFSTDKLTAAVIAMIASESGGRTTARNSRSNAMGLIQFMPSTQTRMIARNPSLPRGSDARYPVSGLSVQDQFIWVTDYICRAVATVDDPGFHAVHMGVFLPVCQSMRVYWRYERYIEYLRGKGVRCPPYSSILTGNTHKDKNGKIIYAPYCPASYAYALQLPKLKRLSPDLFKMAKDEYDGLWRQSGLPVPDIGSLPEGIDPGSYELSGDAAKSVEIAMGPQSDAPKVMATAEANDVIQNEPIELLRTDGKLPFANLLGLMVRLS